MAKKRSKKKIVLIIILVIVVLIAIFVCVFLNMGKNTEGTKAYTEKITKESSQMTERLVSEVDTATEVARAEVSGTQSSDEDVPSDTGTQTQPNAENAVPEMSKAELTENLKAKYRVILEEQKAEALTMIDSLVEDGKNEYLALKQSGGWNATEKTRLVSEYVNRVGIMEDNMDASFESLILRMQENLEAEGIEAEAIIQEFREEYKSVKSETSSAFTDKLFGALKSH